MSAVADLDTPCLVLESGLLERNLQAMQAMVVRAGKQLRPHAKTHKCSALARRQVALGAIGICAAKVAEAERLAAAGVPGILLTGPVATARQLGRLIGVRRAAPSLLAAIDHPGLADRLSEAALAAGLRLDVLVDVDVGLGRSGVAPAEAVTLGRRILALPGLRLRGLQAYAGQVQHLSPHAVRQAESLRCLRRAVPAFLALRAMAPDCTILSGAGTGTAGIDAAIPELSELQAGSYVCMDAEYAGIGAADGGAEFADFAPALRVLTTVVSANQPGFVTVDAGLKSLYRDGGMPRVLAPGGGRLAYDWFGDEYGRITAPGGGPLPGLGEVLAIQPAHGDPTFNLFDRVFLTDGPEVVAEWPIDLRGCST